MTTITSNRDGAVATITIDNAAQGNLLTVEDLRELAAAIRAAGATEAKVIVLRTAGADFCRGRAPGAPSPTAMKMRANVCEPILDVYDAIAGIRQPVVARVQGAALGFGAAMAGACDLTIAADNARFQIAGDAARSAADARDLRADGARAAQGAHPPRLLHGRDRRRDGAAARHRQPGGAAQPISTLRSRSFSPP